MTDSGYPVVARFRTTVGLPGRLSTRLQPNHPMDDPAGIAASVLDGLLLGSGDATISINPASDSPQRTHTLLCLLDEIRQRLDIPTQSCVLAHVTTTLDLIKRGSTVDLVFQSIGGTVYRLSCPQGLRRSLVRQWQDAPAKTRPAPP
jgi:ethanolamine ammonia-lyase large subunit